MILNEQKLKILQEFTKDYFDGLTGSNIANKNKLNQKSVSNTLKELEDDGFLKSETEGKNKLYYLNVEDKEISEHFLAIIEHYKTIHFYKENHLIKEIIEKISFFSEGIIIIFGSYAKNLNKKDSDLDIMIVGKYNEREIEHISKTFDLEINIKCYTLKDFRKENNSYFINEIKRNHIIVSYIDSFVKEVLK